MAEASCSDSDLDMCDNLKQSSLAGMVVKGSKEEVMEYLCSADRTNDDWQRELDECVVIAVTNKKPEILWCLVQAGATLHQNYESPFELLIYSVFRTDDPAIVNIFVKYYEGKNRYRISCPVGVNLLVAAFESKNPELVARAWSMLQTMNNDIVTGSWYPIHELISAHCDFDYDDDYTPTIPFCMTSDFSYHTCLTTEVLDFLTDKGYDINHTNRRGDTPLICAEMSGCRVCIRTLIKHGADVFLENAKTDPVWMLVCEKEDLYIFKDLLQEVNVAEHQDKFESILHEVCKYGWKAAISYLLERGVNVNCTDNENRTPLRIELDQWETDIEIVMCLVQHMLSHRNCDSEVTMINALKVLLGQYDDDEDICSSSEQQLEQIIKGYVRAGINLNLENRSGHTILMDYGVNSCRIKSIELLLQHGADVNAVARDGKSVLWEAINYDAYVWSFDEFESSVCFLHILLSHNIDIRISKHEYEGMTPLQLAFHTEDHVLCNILLDADCSLLKMTEVLNSVDESTLRKEMQEVRTKILEMCELQPYSLAAQARLAVLRTIGQGNLKETLHRIHHCRLLPKQIVNYLGKAIEFNADVEDVE